MTNIQLQELKRVYSILTDEGARAIIKRLIDDEEGEIE